MPIDEQYSGAFLSHDACRAVADRVFTFAAGGGQTIVTIESQWSRDARWAHNAVHLGGETQQTILDVARILHGAGGSAQTDLLDDTALRRCVARAEAITQFRDESPDDYPDPPPVTYPHLQPTLWFERTQQVDNTERAHAAEAVIVPAERLGLVSAGYLRMAAQGRAVANADGLFRYYPYTGVQYSVTVRDRHGLASGWAGVDHNDWTRIDADQLAETAIEKCQRSRNPVAIEPGRYTVILEPQAVCDLVAPLVDSALDREMAERGAGPFADPVRLGYSRIGQRVVDARLTLSADPTDPDCGFVPFDWNGEPYQPVSWIEHGKLEALAYSRTYGLVLLGHDAALPNSRAFRLSGGTTTTAEMIAGTERGVLVTRFDNVQMLDFRSLLLTGYTRDGLWLIEHGKITKPIKNFRFTESPLFVLNNLEALGVPRRVFRPGLPAVVPPLMVRDFSFTGLADAI